LVLPIDSAAETAVTTALAFGHVQEGLVGARIVAEIGKRGGLQAAQRGLLLSDGWSFVLYLRRQRCDLAIGRLRSRRARMACFGGVLGQGTGPCGLKTVVEMSGRKPIVERVAGRGARVAGQCARVRWCIALNENTRQRDKHRQNDDPAQSASTGSLSTRDPG